MNKLSTFLGLVLFFGILPLSFVMAQSEIGEVNRGIFTTEISEREPVDSLATIPAEIEQVYFFTDLRNMTGKTVFHKWYFNDEMSFEIPFEIGGNRWRVWSSITILENQSGTWRVDIVDGDQVLDSFEIGR